MALPSRENASSRAAWLPPTSSALGRARLLLHDGRIDHSEAYSLDGIHTNLAESYFALTTSNPDPTKPRDAHRPRQAPTRNSVVALGCAESICNPLGARKRAGTQLRRRP